MSPVSPAIVWATEADLPETCHNEAVTPATIAEALPFASAILYNITKRRWPGERTDTYRPCCDCDTYRDCCCYPTRTVELPGYPVNSINYVRIDGVDAEATDYELRDSRRLVVLRQPDGTMLQLPRWQDMSLAVGGLHTVEISYKWGEAPPPEGVTAAAILGWEIALGWTPATLGSCRLPKRVTSITRQGMTIALIDPLSLFKEGMVGIPEVDLWTQSLDLGDRGGAEVWDALKMSKASRTN